MGSDRCMEDDWYRLSGDAARDALKLGKEQGAEAERDAIVAYLRVHADGYAHGGYSAEATAIYEKCRQIVSGQHHAVKTVESKPGPTMGPGREE